MMTDIIKMWHGGKLDETEEVSIKSSRAGKAQNGPGIYTTNDLNTGSGYAKGNRSLYYIGIDANINFLEKSNIKYDDAVDFVKSSSGLRKKKDILEDLGTNRDRLNKFDKDNNSIIGANVLLNLMVNYDVCKGENGVNLAKFYADRKIDASIMNGVNSGEGWILIFNTKIIKEKRIFSKTELNANWNSWSFDSPFHQIAQIDFKNKLNKLPNSIQIKDLQDDLKNDLYSKYSENVNDKPIKQIFEMKTFDIKTIDLTKINNDKLNTMYSYDVSEQMSKIDNTNNYVGIVSNGKLVSPLKEITALIKSGIKELKVIDVSGIVAAPENSLDIIFKTDDKVKNKIKKVL